MSTESDRNFIEHLTWDEVAQPHRQTAPPLFCLFGAGAKQHGFHLPMNTDRIQAEWLAARIADRIDGLIWPTVSYGYYPAFVDYAGSASLSAPTFESLIQEIAAGILGYGCRALFVLDTGISTLAPVDRALARLGNSDALHLKVHDGPRYRRAAAKLSEQSHGSHADELETSLHAGAGAASGRHGTRGSEPCPARHETPGPLTPIGYDLAQLQPLRQFWRSDAGNPRQGRNPARGDGR